MKKEIDVVKMRPKFKDVWNIFYAWIGNRDFIIKKTIEEEDAIDLEKTKNTCPRN